MGRATDTVWSTVEKPPIQRGSLYLGAMPHAEKETAEPGMPVQARPFRNMGSESSFPDPVSVLAAGVATGAAELSCLDCTP